MMPDTSIAVPTDSYLSNPDGYRVLDVDGNPIMINLAADPPAATDFIKVTKIESDGKIQLLLGGRHYSLLRWQPNYRHY